LTSYEIRTIPHSEHRYETVGDYWDEGDTTQVRISQMGDTRMEFCVMIHELIEEFLCKRRGISEPNAIKPFDEAYEAKRPEGDESEPGDSPDAPYHKEHVFATIIERQVADELELDWEEYSKAVMAL
jgi:hypothetical protein